MENLKIYEIENSYIDHLVPFAPHLFHNKKENQENERKYIGIILHLFLLSKRNTKNEK